MGNTSIKKIFSYLKKELKPTFITSERDYIVIDNHDEPMFKTEQDLTFSGHNINVKTTHNIIVDNFDELKELSKKYKCDYDIYDRSQNIMEVSCEVDENDVIKIPKVLNKSSLDEIKAQLDNFNNKLYKEKTAHFMN